VDKSIKVFKWDPTSRWWD